MAENHRAKTASPLRRVEYSFLRSPNKIPLHVRFLAIDKNRSICLCNTVNHIKKPESKEGLTQAFSHSKDQLKKNADKIPQILGGLQ